MFHPRIPKVKTNVAMRTGTWIKDGKKWAVLIPGQPLVNGTSVVVTSRSGRETPVSLTKALRHTSRGTIYEQEPLGTRKSKKLRLQGLTPVTNLRQHCRPEKNDWAKDLRKHPTLAETFLWNYLRKGLYGLKFRRQAVILGWIVDFYCPRARLVIEVDGPYHSERSAKDAKRDAVMKDKGLYVLRVTNDQVFSEWATVVVLIEGYLCDVLQPTQHNPMRMA